GERVRVRAGPRGRTPVRALPRPDPAVVEGPDSMVPAPRPFQPRAGVQAMTPSAVSGTPKAANPAAPYSMTRPGSLSPPVRLDWSAVAGRGPWSEGDADEDRLVDQLDAERVADASAHLAGERQEVGGLGAARVGEGEGVLGGDARRADGVALAEAGAVDQPGGGRLDPAPVLRVARERDVRAEPLGDAALQLGELARVENGVGEERPGAAGVGVGRVEDHALAAPQVEDRVARLLQRHPVARPDAELLRQLRVRDGLRLLGLVQRVRDVQDDVPVVALEDAVPVGEAAVVRAERDDGAGLPVVRADLDDRLADVLAVGADVLDRGRADAPGDAGQALDAGQAVGDAAGDEGVPVLTGLDPDEDRVVLRGDAFGAAGADVDDGAGEPVVGHHQVAAAAEHE